MLKPFMLLCFDFVWFSLQASFYLTSLLSRLSEELHRVGGSIFERYRESNYNFDNNLIL